MTIFNGNRWADSEKLILRQKVQDMKRDYGLTPHLVSILIGDSKQSRIYLNLKRKAANSVGADFTIKIFEKNESPQNIINYIKSLNKRSSVHGIMVQLPLPQNFVKIRHKIINAISPSKDVDGLRKNSPYIHPTAKAIYQILTQVLFINPSTKILLIGAKGMVGKNLSNLLQSEKINFTGIDLNDNLDEFTKNADIIITMTGSPNIITGNMIKKDVSIIDIGYPKPDVDYDSVKSKAKFITPVPGGVGPVTISLLLDNLVLSAQKKATTPNN
jgi:methylenetetrahydrofolate dehydrogenase (NADP+)/methenyltetrahydrofolate cyclohydrolase